MTTPTNGFPKSRLHPMIIIAGLAVTLFCAAGIAAIMGWIPTSIGSNNNGALTQADQAATQVNGNTTNPNNLNNPTTTSRATTPAPVHHKQTYAAANDDYRPSNKLPCYNCGIVESIREINTRAQGSGVGAIGGAVVGGLLGNQVGGGHGKEAATVLGAIGGAVAGNQIEGRVNASNSYDISIRMEDGSSRTVHQTNPPQWRSGDRVKIVDGNLQPNG